MTKVTVIIPTYNEAENIESAILDIKKAIKNLKNYKFFILVVDDNSPDGTGEIVKEMIDRDQSITLLTDAKNGLGSAMIRGIRYALTKFHPDIVISTEADGAYDAKIIPFALSKIKEGFDVVVASRDVNAGKTQGWSTSRKFNHWIANKLFATWVAGETEVKDHNGAFRVIRVKGVLDKINFSKFRAKGFAFFNYSLFKLSQITNKVYEMPVTYHFRKYGESKVSFNIKYIKTYLRDILEYIFLCFEIRLISLTSLFS